MKTNSEEKIIPGNVNVLLLTVDLMSETLLWMVAAVMAAEVAWYFIF